MQTEDQRNNDARRLAECWLRNVKHLEAAMQKAGIPYHWTGVQTDRARRILSAADATLGSR